LLREVLMRLCCAFMLMKQRTNRKNKRAFFMTGVLVKTKIRDQPLHERT
jgi:hypothetical protein